MTETKSCEGGDTMTKNELKNILSNARKEKHMTHEQVASKTNKGISRQYYGMIESGDRTPSFDIAKSIAEVLEIERTIFLKLKETKSCKNKLYRARRINNECSGAVKRWS